jgi:hypothetical protein
MARNEPVYTLVIAELICTHSQAIRARLKLKEGDMKEVNSIEIDSFATEARIFCSWATGQDGSMVTAATALNRVSSLFVAALSLSPEWMDELSDRVVAEAKPPHRSIHLMNDRMADLPLQYYWEVFNPLETPPEEPVCGDLAEDIHDIYMDVGRGLVLFESGKVNEALWDWGYSFQIHWGEHATSAIRALHAFLRELGRSGNDRLEQPDVELGSLRGSLCD